MSGRGITRGPLWKSYEKNIFFSFLFFSILYLLGQYSLIKVVHENVLVVVADGQ